MHPTPTRKRERPPSPKRKRQPSPSRKAIRLEERDRPGSSGHGAVTTSTTHRQVSTAAPTSEKHQDAEFERFLSEMADIGAIPRPPRPLSQPIQSPTPIVTPTVRTVPSPVPTAGTGSKPKNPLAGMVKDLRQGFGTSDHDAFHFWPTDLKLKHGVWRAKLPQVRKWVGEALKSIKRNDQWIVASKPGTGKYRDGYNYLVFMDERVGYLSGSSVLEGTQPEARYIAVFLDKNGYTVSAFPSSPDTF
jgi:hypothetical protein